MEAATRLDRRQARKAVIAATLGCGLEFYDFLTFAFFAIQIGETFFPGDDKYLSLMGSLGVFFAGFLGRPIGAWVLGGYGDRVGRKTAMLLSMTMMGIAVAVLALTPSYAQIGIAAPIIAVCARFVQGLALGGEIGSATVYMVESAGVERRGRHASYQGICQGIALTLGALVGLTLSSLLDAEQLTGFGWRIALLLGVSIVPIAVWMRRSLPETHGLPEPEFDPASIGPSLRQIIWLGAALMMVGTITGYISSYMATFGQTQLNLTTQQSMAGQLFGNLMIVVASWAGGIACDRWGRKPLIIIPQVVLTVCILPMIWWVNATHAIVAFIAINLLLGIFNNISGPAVYAAVAESLPPETRTRGFALIYSVPVALFGGSTQLFITWLMKVTGTPLAMGAYLTLISFIGVIVALLLPESAPVKRGWKAQPAAATV